VVWDSLNRTFPFARTAAFASVDRAACFQETLPSLRLGLGFWSVSIDHLHSSMGRIGRACNDCCAWEALGDGFPFWGFPFLSLL